jgi:hypothetical protein
LHPSFLFNLTADKGALDKFARKWIKHVRANQGDQGLVDDLVEASLAEEPKQPKQPKQPEPAQPKKRAASDAGNPEV